MKRKSACREQRRTSWSARPRRHPRRVAEITDGSASLFESGGPLSAAAMAQTRADPRLPEAIRTFARGMLGIYRGNRLLNMLINDRGRMAIGHLALYLHDGGAPD